MGHMPTNLHAQPNKATTLAVVRKLKEAGQDFEFYPTTVEQIKVVTDDILSLLETHEFNSRYHQEIKLLDVGAGDGRVLLSMKQALETTESNKISIEMLAIEKAPTHTNAYRKKGIALVGTEFDQTNFISKSASIAFVNPPYSSFSHWLCTLISQLNFKVLYAIVPERWQADPMIAKAIEARQIKTTTVLAESDFLDGQRAARAKVQIVRFAFNDFEADIVRYAKLSEERRNYACRPTIGRDSTEPFQLFIENELGLNKLTRL